MRLLLQTVTIVLSLIPVLTFNLLGQETAEHDFNFISATSPWLSSDNAAGLCTMPAGSFGYAEARFGKQDGDLCGNNESGNSFDAGVQTESFIRISERIHFYGCLEYNFFKGQKMGGPILMDPSYNPLNFYEDAATTVGVKNKERYCLTGGASYSFNDRWSIGGKIYYESADRTKVKDPRNLSVWMDLDVAAGFRYAPSDLFSFGLNLSYRRTLEQISGDIIGVTDEKYFTFIDRGGYFGSRELFDGSSGFVSESETRPMFNSFYGGSLQIEAGKDTKVFNEITFLRRGGYYGRKSSTTVTFTEHSGNIIGYRGVLTAGKGDNRHRVGLDFRYEGLANNENIYRMNTEVGEYTKVEYYGQNEILKRTDMKASLSYTGYVGIRSYRPTWEYGLRTDMDMRNSRTTIYPFYRNSSVTSLNALIHGARNVTFCRNNIITTYIEGLFAMGFGNPKTDGALASTISDAPRSADIYLYRDFEHKTSMRAGGCLRLRYTRLFGAKIAAYVEARDCFSHLLKKPEHLAGAYRNVFEIKIGCTF